MSRPKSCLIAMHPRGRIFMSIVIPMESRLNGHLEHARTIFQKVQCFGEGKYGGLKNEDFYGSLPEESKSRTGSHEACD